VCAVSRSLALDACLPPSGAVAFAAVRCPTPQLARETRALLSRSEG